jgi:hypothetical protein
MPVPRLCAAGAGPTSRKATPEENAALGIVYQIIACGAGVLELVVRPKSYPGAGTVHGL